MKCVPVLNKDIDALKPETVTMKQFVKALLELAKRHKDELDDILSSFVTKKEVVIKKYGILIKLGRNIDELVELLKYRVRYEIRDNEIIIVFGDGGMRPTLLGYTITIRGKHEKEAKYTVVDVKREGDKIIIRAVAQ